MNTVLKEKNIVGMIKFLIYASMRFIVVFTELTECSKPAFPTLSVFATQFLIVIFIAPVPGRKTNYAIFTQILQDIR